MFDTYRVTSAIFKKCHPSAFDNHIMAQLDAHQSRIANDLEIQRIRAQQRRRERPLRVLKCVLAIATIGLGAWFVNYLASEMF